MYDEEGFQVANEIDRFAIGDRDPLSYNDDGSIDLYIQHSRPADDRVSNWLPAPNGHPGITCGCTRRHPKCSTTAGTRRRCMRA